jgi:hypothetical protein
MDPQYCPGAIAILGRLAGRVRTFHHGTGLLSFLG